MPLLKEHSCTIDDIYALPAGQRAELIDGQIYDMAPPSTRHQIITGEMYATIRDYIRKGNGACRPYVSPFAVFLNEDDKNYLEPDVSPATQSRDYGIKLFKYRTAGVREYWIINPMKEIVNVYDFEKDAQTGLYSFDDVIPVSIYPGFSIRISDLLN